jgi:hypothetical protein
MSTELEDLERRVELLEGQLASAEHRLYISEMHLEIVSSWHQQEREAGRLASAVGQEAGPQTPDAHFGRIESMLRQVLLYQGDHAADIRRVRSFVRILVGRGTS